MMENPCVCELFLQVSIIANKSLDNDNCFKDYVGEVPQLRGCYSQGETIDELMKNIREVIELCLEDDNPEDVWEFVGIQKVSI